MINAEIQELIRKDETSRYVFEELEEYLKAVFTPATYYDPEYDKAIGGRENATKITRARTIKILIKQIESAKNVAISYNDFDQLKALEVWERINNYALLKTELRQIEAQFKHSDFEHLLLLDR